jgi:MerR family transcriptional regulator, thiopeptide resistance regulator
LAKLSGVSVRALHFYDEIGLLKPAYYGENGYRYYENEQLLILQQILFYRELGFPLGEIQKILNDPGFDKLQALESHRHILQQNAEQMKKLISTVDKTIARLKGEAEMTDQEIYYGFDKAKQDEYEKYIVKRGGKGARKLIHESKERTKDWKREDYDKVKKEQDELHLAFTEALKKNLPPTSNEVQKIVDRHFQMINRFYAPTKEVYAGLGDLYIEHPDFRKLYDAFHPGLAEYLADAMKIYARLKL